MMILRNAAPLKRTLAPSHLYAILPLLRVSPQLRWNSTRPPKFEPEDFKATPRQSPQSGNEGSKEQSYNEKVAHAWSTPTKWYPIPIALGALVLLGVQYRKQARGEVEVESQGEVGAVLKGKADGPWQVRVMGALPLRSVSQLWGYLNGLVLPVWFRPFGFTLYAKIFGCNLDEVPKDLKEYESLGDFFYREIKVGARPVADSPMVSPADGKVLHFGEIVGERVEQVKGITYSLGALLGSDSPAYGQSTDIPRTSQPQVVEDENFAKINDIPYSLSALLGQGAGPESAGQTREQSEAKKHGHVEDASHPPKGEQLAHDASVAAQLGVGALGNKTNSHTQLPRLSEHNKLFFMVIYLAPGDYHRFHSPTSWVVERRRHFTGDLFSVSPYIANRMQDLFVLNERVALLGRWKHGFYSMVPVGATNVGSIRINFDQALRTNTRVLSHPPKTYAEATYSSASVLKGQPLLAGEEMGGFRLGSTVVLVFEAPENWKFGVEAGEKVKVGQALGKFEE
ncbi:phosphatidylserine decarboxylase [Cryptococcus amylolentus CBS 6039]|uniref:Phosphatidylserine decarboxylase proenzyme 1, mitochondrial n=1 Tax=Cryptococcus amylolentus CBS 6039 TaxID=1295533 RepID=A0A1E3I563_9TREE|nr:phosphatidylserine decarboxylase [Cryptococcus amylolentus CBS 6039]ODN83495.1 phosphatidylserine decarboxylase [Cryptococcus amylolentus CBS 6039]